MFVEGEGKWMNALIAQFIGRITNFGLFHRMVNKLWGKGGTVDLRPAGKNIFLIQFSSA